jgi:hypothetical protein
MSRSKAQSLRRFRRRMSSSTRSPHVYLPPEAVRPYVELAKADHGEQVVIVMRPERWLSSDLGPA